MERVHEWDSVRIHVQGPLEVYHIKAAKTETLLEKLAVNINVDPAGKVLPGNKRLDYFCHTPLLMNVNQRLQVHGWWKRMQSRKYIRMRKRIEDGRNGVDTKKIIGSSWID